MNKTMNEEEAIILSHHETIALAKAMIRDRLADCGEWAHWELVPLIDEDSYHLVLAEIEYVFQKMVMATSIIGGDKLMQRVS